MRAVRGIAQLLGLLLIQDVSRVFASFEVIAPVCSPVRAPKRKASTRCCTSQGAIAFAGTRSTTTRLDQPIMRGRIAAAGVAAAAVERT
jgi:hypothetical protein